MKKYERLDSNRPYTLNEIFRKTSFMKRSEVKKLVEKIIQAQPSLKERAIYMKRETDLYSQSVMWIMPAISADYKKASELTK